MTSQCWKSRSIRQENPDVEPFDSEKFLNKDMKLLYARSVTRGTSKLARAVKTLDGKIAKHSAAVASCCSDLDEHVKQLDKQASELTALYGKLNQSEVCLCFAVVP